MRISRMIVLVLAFGLLTGFAASADSGEVAEGATAAPAAFLGTGLVVFEAPGCLQSVPAGGSFAPEGGICAIGCQNNFDCFLLGCQQYAVCVREENPTGYCQVYPN